MGSRRRRDVSFVQVVRAMAKIKLTKSELKRQKEGLKRFHRYLPMLALKKKQLQSEIAKVHHQIKETSDLITEIRNSVISWVDVFGEEVDFEKIIKIKSIQTSVGNVAGIDLPIFKAVVFEEVNYDLIKTPLWVDQAVDVFKKTISLRAKITIFHKQIEILKNELRIATQRVNLFEKIKIPQAQENIRVVQIYLGEVQTAEVVRGKIAKAKIERKKG